MIIETFIVIVISFFLLVLLANDSNHAARLCSGAGTSTNREKR
jgi:hypothetical protein